MNPSILIVDDEALTRNLLRLMLERDGFEVAEAEDGEQALEVVQTQLPDVVIMDVMMPNMDGFTACQHLRNQPETVNLPIILLSARTQIEAVRAGLQAGADRYMTKPISKPELINTISELLTETPSGKQPVR
ncbi:MAG: response regulator [Chloroflexi bacterium]|nr:response regulator [Chloroflexota bacterium]